MNGKELTASFWKGVKTARELKMLSSGWNPSTKQKVQIRKVVVLCDAEYKRYMDGELDQPKIFLAEDKERLRYDTRHHAWNCLLVVGESSKDGILAGVGIEEIPANGEVSFSIDLEAGETETETAKIMLWDIDTMRSVIGATEVE